METTHLTNLREVPLTHEEAWGIFPRSRLLAGQLRPHRPRPGAIGHSSARSSSPYGGSVSSKARRRPENYQVLDDIQQG